jgi:sulfur-carrier protein adenylyltransferase/sulfurtransferase
MIGSDRYDRQTILPEIGPAGQDRLRRARVLCVGAGGLGCAALPYLAAAGVGTITLIDGDRLERSNLQRQVLYRDRDVGTPKARAAAAHLRALNPEVDVIGLEARLDAGNVDDLLRAHDLVIDGSDNYATKFLLGDATASLGMPLVYGSATGMEAMVTVFDARHGPCLRCLYPQPPRGWVPNCATAGVLGPLVGMVGAIQAAEAIKLLAGVDRLPGGQSLVGRLWVLDARDMTSRQIATARRSGCPTCAGTPAPLDVPTVTCAPLEALDAATAAAWDDASFVDVREPEEYARGHIPGALLRPLSTLRQAPDALPPAPRYVLYCATGPRSVVAARLLAERGIGRLAYLHGGIAAWGGGLVVEGTPT